MCGICGTIDPLTAPTAELLSRMLKPLDRRGPDGEGTLLEGPVALGHRRLSIIDLEGGRQPILNEDGTLAIVCNGEIYNYQSLRQELERLGHRFRTQSDSEVALHLYEEHGPDSVCRLNGMFAFAIVDLRRHEAFLARDPFGQKPLYLAATQDRLAFASLPASLLQLPWVDQTPDPQALHLYFDWQCIPAPWSYWSGIQKLRPGTWAQWTRDGLKTQGFWSPEGSVVPVLDRHYRDQCQQMRHLMREAVRRHLIADVPVGAFLSGGLDSSIVAALAAETLADSGRKLHTFSIGFPEKAYDEREFSDRVARHLNTEHHFLEVNPADPGFLQELMAEYGEPFSDASMIPTALLARFAQSEVKAVVGGDGADELFGGYCRYFALGTSARLDLLPVPGCLRSASARLLLRTLPDADSERTRVGKLRRLAAMEAEPPARRPMNLASRFPEAKRLAAYTEPFRHQVGGFSSADYGWGGSLWPQQRLWHDQRTYLPDDTLTKVDRSSMMFGLEVRAPFLDLEVASFANSLPITSKIHGGRRKRILADTFSDLLPDGIAGRGKMGFAVPLAAWFRGGWRDWARQEITGGSLDDLFPKAPLATLFQEHLDGKADHGAALYTLLILALFRQKRS